MIRLTNILTTFIYPTLVLFLVVGFLQSGQAAEKPNIVFIYADDIGYGDFSCYGGTGAAQPTRTNWRLTDCAFFQAIALQLPARLHVILC
jgi:hypothetical protein